MEFVAFLVQVFHSVWADLVGFVGERPLVASSAAAGFLLVVGLGELRAYRRGEHPYAGSVR